jgi:hypothetical protein
VMMMWFRVRAAMVGWRVGPKAKKRVLLSRFFELGGELEVRPGTGRIEFFHALAEEGDCCFGGLANSWGWQLRLPIVLARQGAGAGG